MMARAPDDPVVIPFGCAGVTEPATAAAHHVVIDRAARRTLRLYDGDWRFDDPPDPVRLADSVAALGFLRDQLQRLCDPWTPHQARFIAQYVGFIAATIAAEAPVLEARLARFGGLYRVADFGYSALRPLPRAHLPDATGWIAVDAAFWTGAALVAVDIADTRRTRRRRSADHARLAAAGVEVIELAPEQLSGDPLALAAHLPAALARFCDGEALPSSPFKTTALGDIVDADPPRT